jgi:hypothetical protein
MKDKDLCSFFQGRGMGFELRASLAKKVLYHLRHISSLFFSSPCLSFYSLPVCAHNSLFTLSKMFSVAGGRLERRETAETTQWIFLALYLQAQVCCPCRLIVLIPLVSTVGYSCTSNQH